MEKAITEVEMDYDIVLIARVAEDINEDWKGKRSLVKFVS